MKPLAARQFGLTVPNWPAQLAYTDRYAPESCAARWCTSRVSENMRLESARTIELEWKGSLRAAWHDILRAPSNCISGRTLGVYVATQLSRTVPKRPAQLAQTYLKPALRCGCGACEAKRLESVGRNKLEWKGLRRPQWHDILLLLSGRALRVCTWPFWHCLFSECPPNVFAFSASSLPGSCQRYQMVTASRCISRPI